jgi:DHA1 family bicyclomycin/chloramphenicol resistance-like MFS transporter
MPRLKRIVASGGMVGGAPVTSSLSPQSAGVLEGMRVRRLNPQSFAFLLLLGGLGSLPPLAIDMSLPALAAMAADFRVSVAATGWTLSLFLAGFSVAQLLFGPMSERFGRRPILIFGCALFSAASFLASLAPDLASLLILRFFAGFGAGAGAAMNFAIVRDLFEGARARTRLAYVSTVINVAPMVAPSLGTLILMFGSWRVVNGVLGLGGALLTTAVLLGLEESRRGKDRHALVWRRLAAVYAKVATTPSVIGNALISGFSFACMFSWISGSSNLMMRLFHLSAGAYSGAFALTSFGIMIGSVVSGQLSRRHWPAAIPLSVGLAGALAGALTLLALTLANAASVSTFLPLLVFCCFCAGLIVPNAAHGALHPMPEIAGVVGATLVFVQMMCGSLASALVAHFDNGRTPLSMTVSMAFFSFAALAIYWLWVGPAARRLETVAAASRPSRA